MKIEINNKEQNTEIKFPCLMISNDGKAVIVATKEGDRPTRIEGFALKDKEGVHFCTKWMKENFKPFNGSITLSNE
jgi:uncharacterized pyridoxamine 5'-phosphate oxidase family protein